MQRFLGTVSLCILLGGAGCASSASDMDCALTAAQATELAGLQRHRIALWEKARPASVARSKEANPAADDSAGAALIAGGRVLTNVTQEALGRRPEPVRPDPALTYAVPIEGRPTKGSEAALVTIVIFSDFECPFCSRVVPTLEKLLETYPNDLRMVFRHTPLSFHRRAMPAALAAECAAEDGKFWPMHDLLFAHQRDLEDKDLKSYAAKLGLKEGAFAECFDTESQADTIEADLQVGRSFGVRGTPAFFINGRYMSGAQPYARFAKIVDEVLGQAKASGVAAEEYYDTVIMGQGKKSL